MKPKKDKQFSREFFVRAGRKGGKNGKTIDKIRAANTRWARVKGADA